MYEHPVFCLASQVMDLTIREYLPPPHHAVFTLSVSIISRNPDPNQLTLLASSFLALACLLVLSVKPSVRSPVTFYQPKTG